MPGRRTSIAARASSRWTESDRAALERARTRVHAREVAEGANSRLATSRDRTDGASPSSRAPKIFRHTVREAFGEWLPAISRDALSRARENVPPANATRDVSRSRSGPPATTAPDVSVATLAKVRAWVRAWRAKTKASDLTRLVGGEGRDVEKNEKNKFTKKKQTDSVFVSTNARAAARACADPLGAAPQSRYAGYVTRCAHLAFGGDGSDADQTGYFEEETGRWIPAHATRRVVVETETETERKQTRRAAFVFCPACHDAFLVRALTRCDPSANACHACGSRVPRSATIVQSTAGGETTCVFCAFSLKVKKNQSRSRSVEKTEKELETAEPQKTRACRATTSEDDDPPKKTALDHVTTSKGAHLETSEPSSTAFALGRPACAFLDAEDVPGLDALRSAVAGAAPPVALAWDAEARRARNAETDVRWRVPSLPGSSRVARNAETDAPGDETNSETNWGFLHAGMPPPLEADDFPARHASSFR